MPSGEDWRIGPLSLDEIGSYRLQIDWGGDAPEVYRIQAVDVAVSTAGVVGEGRATLTSTASGPALRLSGLEFGFTRADVVVDGSDRYAGAGYVAHTLDFDNFVLQDGNDNHIVLRDIIQPSDQLYPVFSQFSVPTGARYVTVKPPNVELEDDVILPLKLGVALPTDWLTTDSMEVGILGGARGEVPTCMDLESCDPHDLATFDVFPIDLDLSYVDGSQDILADRIDLHDRGQDAAPASAATFDPIERIDALLTIIERSCDNLIFGSWHCTSRVEKWARNTRAQAYQEPGLSQLVHATQSVPNLNANNQQIWSWLPAATHADVGSVLGVAYPDYYPLYVELYLAVYDATNSSHVSSCMVPECNSIDSSSGASTSQESNQECVGRKGERTNVEGGDYSDCWQIVTVGHSVWQCGWCSDEKWTFHGYVYASKDLDDNGSEESIGTGWATEEDEYFALVEKSSYVAYTYSRARYYPDGHMGPCTWGHPGPAYLVSQGTIHTPAENGAGRNSVWNRQVKPSDGYTSLRGTPYTDCFTAGRSENQLTYMDVMSKVSPSADGTVNGPPMLTTTFGHTIGGFVWDKFGCEVVYGGSKGGFSVMCKIYGEWTPNKDAWEAHAP